MYQAEKAKIADVETIHALINEAAKKNQMLPRSLQSLYENLRSFFVCRDGTGEAIGCCALAIAWSDMAEIRSLAVSTRYKKRGIGSILVSACLQEAKELGIKKVFTLTYVPGFFKKQHFRVIDKKKLPHKIWSDCIHCPHFPDCDEVSLIKMV
ncbi:MAG TPA: N-acetyltransferase [Candidatus Bathyarchaeia archaeon]|nr:N-acetyltransferase [Candidatus Bathyarchaeia archaeon]